MYPDGLTDNQMLKVKELCALVNISNEDAFKLLKPEAHEIDSKLMYNLSLVVLFSTRAEKIENGLALELSDEEWDMEWDTVLSLASPLPRKQEDDGSNSTDQIYESLESIHVFALAHVLKRPIVVVSDTILLNAKGEEISPVRFGGVYLPLECPPSQCHRSPLVLCYDSAHFSPLVLMRTETNNKQIIPIIDVNRNLLPVHFATDPGEAFNWWKGDSDKELATTIEMKETDELSLISQYMDIIRLDVRRGSIRSTRRVRSAHAPLTESNRSHREIGVMNDQPSNSAKGMTLACSGISGGRHEKWRIINEIRTHVLRTLRISSPQKVEKLIDTEDCIARMNSTCVLASELLPTHHQYMDKIINEYMKSAKQRFQQNQRTTSESRKRISRSFSASSLMLTCIGCDSEFKPASQVTGSESNDKENVQLQVLNVVARDGTSAKTSMRAIEDEHGTVHYYMDDDVIKPSEYD